jgi:pimeloyl-ACP methyl ester carboxylesterase
MFKYILPLVRLPGAIPAMVAPLRIGAVARAAYKPFSKTPIPAELIESWLEPSRKNAAVRRDLKQVSLGMNKRHTLEAAEKLRGSELPILLTWAPRDRYFPLKYAQRLATEAGNARIVEIPDSKTFVPVDQPQRLADEIASFVGSPRSDSVPA